MARIYSLRAGFAPRAQFTYNLNFHADAIPSSSLPAETERGLLTLTVGDRPPGAKDIPLTIEIRISEHKIGDQIQKISNKPLSFSLKLVDVNNNSFRCPPPSVNPLVKSEDGAEFKKLARAILVIIPPGPLKGYVKDGSVFVDAVQVGSVNDSVNVLRYTVSIKDGSIELDKPMSDPSPDGFGQGFRSTFTAGVCQSGFAEVCLMRNNVIQQHWKLNVSLDKPAH